MRFKSYLLTVLINCALGVAVVLGAFGIGLLFAAALPPPSRMSVEDTARLDRAIAHLREIDQAQKQLAEQAKPYADEAKAVLESYKVDVSSFAKGETQVDFKTGDIKRPSSKPGGGTPPPPPTKPTK